MTAHDFTFTAIDGVPLALADFAGKAVLVVNTASECGFTPQYADLQNLAATYGGRGLVVLGVPSNDFGGQEPGDEAAIAEFCATRYNVDFPMTQKYAVIGGDAHPFYRWIADVLGEDHAPRWNFHKYLIDGAGELAGAWPSQVTPLSAEITTAVEDALGAL
jgi:glutathione peroxidase